MSDMLKNDVDPIETRDWLQAIESVIREEGVDRAQFIIEQVLSEARKGGVNIATGASGSSDYINTIAVEDEPAYPGNMDLERRIRSAIRWNAVMTVLRASRKIWNWVAIWHHTSLQRLYMKFALTISSALITIMMAGIWSSSKVIFLQEFTLVHS